MSSLKICEKQSHSSIVVDIEQASSVTMNGIKYSNGLSLCTCFKGGLGEFRQKRTIVLRNGEVFFLCHELTCRTLSFENRYHAYVVELPIPRQLRIVTKKDLVDYYPLHVYDFGGKNFIVLKHYMLDEDWL